MIPLAAPDVLVAVPLYAYFLYPLMLRLIPRITPVREEGPLPQLSVIVPVHNGAASVRERLRNLLSSDYDIDRLEILIVDDGSTDGTAAEATALKDARIKVLRVSPQRGRANAHRLAAEKACGDVLVFSDVDTTFAPSTLRALASPFSDQRVGCVTGRLAWRNEDNSETSRDMGAYWRFEMSLRAAESSRGLLAVASGACMAVRKNCFPDLRLFEDIDCAAPLEIRLSGYLVHHSDATASDEVAATVRGELRGRVRMVALDVRAISRRIFSTRAIRAPSVAWSVASHKLARWFGGPSVLLHFVSVAYSGRQPFLSMYAVAAAAIAVGAAGAVFQIRIPVASQAFSFAVAQIGFTAGLLKGLFGAPIEKYSAAE